MIKRSPSNERWLLSYADLITLLFSLFVVLYLLAQLDQEKYTQIQHSIQAALFKNQRTKTLGTMPPQQHTAAQKEETAGEQGETFLDPIAKEGVSIWKEEGRVAIQIDSELLFEKGDSTLKASGFEWLHALSKLLVGRGLSLKIEGHTDDAPIHNEYFPSNWELSAHRAASVARAMIDDGYNPMHIEISGFAQYRPIASNVDESGRKQNRRIMIYLLSQ